MEAELYALFGIAIAKLLITINKRIELLYNRENTIGHSFFLPLECKPTIERLARIFELDILHTNKNGKGLTALFQSSYS